VTVNGVTVTELSTQVDPSRDVVRVSGNPVTLVPQLVYVLMNKPKDCMTTTDDERGRRTVMDLLPLRQRLYPVGRLDRNTTGALLLTNDGDLAFGLTHPSFRVPKVYRVVLDRALRAPDLRSLRTGMRLDDGPTAPCDAEILDAPASQTVGIILHEGRNRQVRRMFEALGYGVTKLERVMYAGLSAAGLRRGEWRFLREAEVHALKALLRARKA
jgi:23S rRNA pseudouridine2605 synthase